MSSPTQAHNAPVLHPPCMSADVTQGTANPGHWRPWGLGGSDAAAVLGLSRFKGPLDVWLEKVQDPRRSSPSASSPSQAAYLNGPTNLAHNVPTLPQRLGHFLEPFVVQEYERVCGAKTYHDPAPLRHPAYPELFGHSDRLVAASPSRPGVRALLECKTCGAHRANEWGASWGDEVPMEYLVQCLWYLGLSGLDEAHLAVLLGGNDFRVYRIPAQPDISAVLFERAHDFWVRHVLAGVPPSPKTRAQAQALHPTPVSGSLKEASQACLELLQRYALVTESLSEVEGLRESLLDELACAMGDAEYLHLNGQALASWRASRGGTRLDLERLRRDHPELVSEYSRTQPPTRRLLVHTDRLPAASFLSPTPPTSAQGEDHDQPTHFTK